MQIFVPRACHTRIFFRMKPERTDVPVIGTWSPISKNPALIALGTTLPQAGESEGQREAPSLSISALDLNNKSSGSLSMCHCTCSLYLIRNTDRYTHRDSFPVNRLVLTASYDSRNGSYCGRPSRWDRRVVGPKYHHQQQDGFTQSQSFVNATSLSLGRSSWSTRFLPRIQPPKEFSYWYWRVRWDSTSG